MDELILTGEILGILVAVLLASVAWLLIRRSLIAREGPLVLMCVYGRNGWRTGLGRVGDHEVGWFPLIGIRTTPEHRWGRGRLDLGPPETGGQRPVGMSDPVQVRFSSPDGDVEVMLARTDYTTVRSWSESAPPGLNTNVA